MVVEDPDDKKMTDLLDVVTLSTKIEGSVDNPLNRDITLGDTTEIIENFYTNNIFHLNAVKMLLSDQILDAYEEHKHYVDIWHKFYPHIKKRDLPEQIQRHILPTNRFDEVKSNTVEPIYDDNTGMLVGHFTNEIPSTRKQDIPWNPMIVTMTSLQQGGTARLAFTRSRHGLQIRSILKMIEGISGSNIDNEKKEAMGSNILNKLGFGKGEEK